MIVNVTNSNWQKYLIRPRNSYETHLRIRFGTIHLLCYVLHKVSIRWVCSWWRNQMETYYALLAFCAGNSPVTGEFPSQRPVTRSFDSFFDLRLNKHLTKRSRGWWFETPSRSLSNVMTKASTQECTGFTVPTQTSETKCHCTLSLFKGPNLNLLKIWTEREILNVCLLRWRHVRIADDVMAVWHIPTLFTCIVFCNIGLL